MDSFIVMAIRVLAQLSAYVGAWSIRLGEHLKAWQQQRPLPTNSTPNGAAGVPANVLATSAALAQVAVSPPIAPAAAPPVSSPAISTTPKSVASEAEALPDELDWAGSLNHAAVASLHLSQVLAMVRAGWLVSERDHLDEVCAAFDAMEAFRDRTVSAIAPVVAAMTDEQRAEFFADFGAGLPPELPDLESEDMP
ncbi:MAG: hypothetical protein LKM32_02135 [Chiayiivirga sp.]|uniref:hypothetical protein n=1 Tax=Chiayiivirga sp. TaxID=2041042 RepID=UPI0025B87697|nr:hypothetical protein [Chiayiivirga sp.]MCI1728235.1 hypothetical protein [Chiayiivirga sp.]